MRGARCAWSSVFWSWWSALHILPWISFHQFLRYHHYASLCSDEIYISSNTLLFLNMLLATNFSLLLRWGNAFYLSWKSFSVSLEISVDGVSVPEEEREGHAWLQERGKPDLSVVGAEYRGPPIVEKWSRPFTSIFRPVLAIGWSPVRAPYKLLSRFFSLFLLFFSPF